MKALDLLVFSPMIMINTVLNSKYIQNETGSQPTLLTLMGAGGTWSQTWSGLRPPDLVLAVSTENVHLGWNSDSLS